MWAWQVRDTCAPLSPIHGAGEYQPRVECDCWGCALFGDTVKASVPALLLILSSSEEHKQPRSFCFLEPDFFLVRTPRRHKPSSESHSLQYPRTARTAEQPSIGPARSSQVHAVVRSCRPGCDNPSKQAFKSKQVKCCREPCTGILCFFFSSFFAVSLCKSQQQLIWIFWQVPLTLSPVTGRRLDYTIFSVDIGVTDFNKNNRLFAVTSTTWSTLLLAVRV